MLSPFGPLVHEPATIDQETVRCWRLPLPNQRHDSVVIGFILVEVPSEHIPNIQEYFLFAVQLNAIGARSSRLSLRYQNYELPILAKKFLGFSLDLSVGQAFDILEPVLFPCYKK